MLGVRLRFWSTCKTIFILSIFPLRCSSRMFSNNIHHNNAINAPFCVVVDGEFASSLMDRTVGIGTWIIIKLKTPKERIDHRVDCFLFAEWYLMGYNTERIDSVPASFTIKSSTNGTVDGVFDLY
uniref:Uncharacterized protein n=2 Tax=Glossina palpalis gambiensis TaxID=67801 RepID=A0A1B0C521_9MUSC